MANDDISSNMPNYDPSANPPYDENEPIVFEIKQYVGQEDVVYSNYTNLVFISGQLERDERFSKYCNSNTYPIAYDYQLDGDSIMEFIQNFTNVKRIAFAFHGPKSENEYTELPFINIGPLFSTDDLSNTSDNLSENVLFVKRLIQQFSLENIDFLGCKVLLYNEWKQYLDLLQNDSLVIGASDDDTGNIKYGGDWIMENTMENIQHIYFNEDLSNYVSLLTDSDSSEKLVPHQKDLPFTYNGVTYTTWDSWINGFSYTRGINYNSSIYTQSRLLPGNNQYYHWGNVFDGGIIRGGNGLRQNWGEASYRGFIKFPYYIIWKLDGLKTVNKVVIYAHYEGKNSAPKKFDIISSTVNMTIPTANVTVNPGSLKNDSNWNVIQTVEETVPYVNGWVTNDNGTTTTDNKTYTFPSTEAKFIGIKIYTHMSSSSPSGNLEEIVFYGGPPSPDTEAPVITLIGPSTITQDVGYNYIENNATAVDTRDGNLTSSIVMTGSVDPNTAGTYEVKYNVSDAYGNQAIEVIRTVIVNAIPPLPAFSTEWYQLGGNIVGEAEGDQSGSAVSISSDGSIVAIGARYNDGNGTESGHVRIYQRDSNKTVEVTDQNSASFGPVGWTRLGQDIDGPVAGDRSTHVYGLSLSSNGTIVTIGYSHSDAGSSNAGTTIVYQYDNTNNNWNQLGQDIYGEAAGDYSGYSTSLSSDGTIVAISAHSNAGNGSKSGHVRVYQYTNNTWSQLGQDIDGEATADYSGGAVSLSSDGTIVAISAVNNDGNGDRSGHVRVYQYTNNTWSQSGGDIDGEAEGDQSGRGISLSSDGSIVAIGAPYNDANGINVIGHVRVYQRDTYKTVAVTDQNNSSFGPVGWTRLGQDIDGDVENDTAGWSASLSSDGSILAVGVTGYNRITGSQAGRVKVYQYDIPNNTWNQIANDIIGDVDKDYFGFRIELSSNGTILVVGGQFNDENGTDSGHVKVYSIAQQDTEAPVITLNASTTLTITAGDSYTDAIPTASDNIDGDLTSGIVTTGSVDPTTPGIYEVKYNVSDATGNEAIEVIRTVTVLDVTPPVITLNASTTLTISAGDSYTDAIPTASDNIDGDLTSSIVTTGSVDPTIPGTYGVKYNVSDAAGNDAIEVIRTVTVLDVTPPVITLNGSTRLTISVGDSYTDAIPTASDNIDGDLTSSIVTTGSVDPNTPGIYTVKYNVSDAAGNNANEVVRTVNVIAPDVRPPITRLKDENPINLNLNETYTEYGATSYDERYGDVTNDIVITGSVDTTTPGIYEIKYNVADPLGNAAIEVVRTVNVVQAPIITLNGPSLVSLEIGDTYTELNATAVDSIDGDITNNIVITSNVDTSSQGTYAVRYNVSNSNESNAIEIIRTVIVVEPIGSVDIETLTTAVPTIEVTDSDTVSIPTFSDKTILTSGTPSEKIAKRKLFMKEFFTKNLRKVSDKKVKMSKEDLLGTTSVIAKAELVIQKAENTEVPVDLSNLSEDEGIYTYMDRIGDFVVLEISAGKKIKVEKMNETQYKIYEDYENDSSPVTKIMNEGETGTYSGFGYQIGSFSGPTDPGLLSTPICFPSGTPITTDQGDIKIEMLNKDVNTIDGKRIVDITETAPIFKYLIRFEKGSIGNNIPSKKTEMSPDHCVLYEGILMKASDVAKKCENVYSIPFIQEKLYNVLMEKHDTMMVNDLCCETLNPDNILLYITNSDEYDISIKQKLLRDYNTLLMA